MISAATDPEFGQFTVSEREVGFLGKKTAPDLAISVLPKRLLEPI